MKILVTGGAGYIGTVLIPLLLERNYQVRVLDNLRFGGEGLLPYFINPAFSLIKGDICDETVLRKALDNIDIIIHLAAIVGFPACEKEPSLAEKVNLEATSLINDLRLPHQKIIFASTNSNYGDVPDGHCTEDTPLNPLTLYGRTKTKAEQLLLQSGNVVICRLASAFGLSSRLRSDLLVNDFVFTALREKRLTVYEKNFQRSFIHVRDIARSLLFAIEQYEKMVDQTYNIGSEKLNISKEELVMLIKKFVDFEVIFGSQHHDPEQRNYHISYARLRQLGFRTTISLEQGIQELIRGFAALT